MRKRKHQGQYMGTSSSGASTWLYDSRDCEEGLDLYFTTSNPTFGVVSLWSAKVKPDFFVRLAQWYDDEGLIQDLLPELDRQQREQLITGIKDYDAFLGRE